MSRINSPTSVHRNANFRQAATIVMAMIRTISEAISLILSHAIRDSSSVFPPTPRSHLELPPSNLFGSKEGLGSHGSLADWEEIPSNNISDKTLGFPPKALELQKRNRIQFQSRFLYGGEDAWWHTEVIKAQ